MLCTEPILRCMADNHGVFLTDICDASKSVKFFPYSIFSAFAMVLFYFLLVDFAVFSNSVSAYVLVVGRMLPEVGLFLLALLGALLTFSSAFSCLEQSEKEFQGIPTGILSLW